MVTLTIEEWKTKQQLVLRRRRSLFDVSQTESATARECSFCQFSNNNNNESKAICEQPIRGHLLPGYFGAQESVTGVIGLDCNSQLSSNHAYIWRCEAPVVYIDNLNGEFDPGSG
jgi:hypothetical protein